MAKAMMKSMVAASHSVLSNIDAPAAEASGKHLRKSSGSGKDRASLWHRGCRGRLDFRCDPTAAPCSGCQRASAVADSPATMRRMRDEP
jgi:hypothetical protein